MRVLALLLGFLLVVTNTLAEVIDFLQYWILFGLLYIPWYLTEYLPWYFEAMK